MAHSQGATPQCFVGNMTPQRARSLLGCDCVAHRLRRFTTQYSSLLVSLQNHLWKMVNFIIRQALRQISRELGRARNTVRKAVRDSSPPEYHRSKEIKRPVIDPVKDFIDTILKEDGQHPKKQRHTAARIYERLIQEKNFSGCERGAEIYI
ncbi:MAG: hypothetical protein P9M03_05745 [Candidatus Theseobacter exili]|nr:hypothetical protein [Candidatus Theseobacter exili]